MANKKMKPIIIFSLLPVVLFFTTCNKTTPTESISFNKGEYSGIFSVTFKNYQNSNSLTQKGKIFITFYDSTYEYSANVDYSSDSTAYTFLTDKGRYSINRKNIIMRDVSWLIYGPGRRNSLYLFDTLAIKSCFDQIEISKDNSYANWKLDLLLENN